HSSAAVDICQSEYVSTRDEKRSCNWTSLKSIDRCARCRESARLTASGGFSKEVLSDYRSQDLSDSSGQGACAAGSLQQAGLSRAAPLHGRTALLSRQ